MTERAKLDWERARRRLEESRMALEETLAPDAKRIEAAYLQRAKRFARPFDPLRHEPVVSVLVFHAAGGRYGVELSGISEILAGPRLARVPGAPPDLAGVVQVRGEIRPVWDYARLLGIPGGGAAGAVLLISGTSGKAGLLVDDVDGIRELRQSDLGPPPEGRTHVKWITPDFITIVDPEQLFKSREDIG
jgi:purine-binding chemotaxis protein CheW